MARQGREADLDRKRREAAHWMSLLLTAQTGETFTAAQLLGEEAEEQTARLIEAEADAEALIERMKIAGIA